MRTYLPILYSNLNVFPSFRRQRLFSSNDGDENHGRPLRCACAELRRVRWRSYGAICNCGVQRHASCQQMRHNRSSCQYGRLVRHSSGHRPT